MCVRDEWMHVRKKRRLENYLQLPRNTPSPQTMGTILKRTKRLKLSATGCDPIKKSISPEQRVNRKSRREQREENSIIF